MPRKLIIEEPECKYVVGIDRENMTCFGKPAKELITCEHCIYAWHMGITKEGINIYICSVGRHLVGDYFTENDYCSRAVKKEEEWHGD